MRRRVLVLAAVTALSATIPLTGGASSASAAARPLPVRLPASAPAGTPNLLVNPGGDAGVCGSGNGGVSIPGWTVTGDTAVVCWAEGNGYPVAADPGPTDRGVGFFTGGNVAESSMTQTVDVSASATAIDAGQMSVELSGWLGGYAAQNDVATLSADFLTAGGSTISTRVLPTVTATDRSSATALLLRTSDQTIPTNTRQIRVVVTYTRDGGTANDGYADSIALKMFAGATAVTTTTSATTTPPVTVPPVVYGPNLVVNGNADNGACGDGTPGPVTGWTGTTAAPICWGTPGGYPGAATPGPTDRGTTFLGGGNSAITRLVQDIDLHLDAAAIDTGRVTFEFSGWLGGYLNQDDGVRLSVNLLDEAGLPIGIAVLGPVTAGERANATALLSRTSTGPVPPGARTAHVELLFTRTGTSPSNDGYADSIVYRQNIAAANPDPVVPESGLAVALSGSAVVLLAAVFVIRRRRNERFV